MNKIICDICGTTYPDTAQQCPICGYANESAELLAGETAGEAGRRTEVQTRHVKGGRFSASNVRKRSKADEEAFAAEEDGYGDNYFEEREPERDANPFLVVLLVVVIAMLLVTTAFILFRYYLPNVLPEETVPTTEAVQQESTEESTVPTVPCTSLVITDGVLSVTLKEAGDKHLVNVFALPEDTTDELIYTSSNEAVATVNKEGRVTAVAEGEAEITVTCGTQTICCTVICDFTPEETESTPETEPTEESTEPLLDIQLFLNYKDVTLGYRGETIKFTFNEELTAEDILWTSSRPEVATVDNGVVVGVGHGNTVITAQYGDQTVQCIIRCSFW